MGTLDFRALPSGIAGTLRTDSQDFIGLKVETYYIQQDPDGHFLNKSLMQKNKK